MELRHARYFVAVAEELNFRRAAERLHLAQPSLSTQIRLLEEDVGVQLLERDSHKVGLLPSVLRLFRQRFPDVQLLLSEMDSTAQIEQIAGNRIDLGLIGLGLPKDIPELEIVVVAEERLVAAIPQDHPLARKSHKSIPLRTLADERFLLGSRVNAPVFNPWIIVLCQQAGFQPNVVQESGQPMTVLNYVAAGLGVTILPAQFSRLVTAGVCFIPLARPTPGYRYCAARMRSNRNPAVANFIRITREVGKGVGDVG